MKKRFALLFLLNLFLAASSFAQQQNKGFFVVKGQVQNEKNVDTLTCYLTCYIATVGQKSLSIPIAKNGKFEKKIETEGNQNLSIVIGDFWTTLYIKPNDTITLNYDRNDLANSIQITGNNTKRTEELNFDYKFSKEFLPKEAEMVSNVYKDKTQSDSVKVNTYNDEYNQEFQYITSDKKLDKEAKDLRTNDCYFNLIYNMCIRVFLNRMPEFLKYNLIDGSKNVCLEKISYSNIPKYRMIDTSLFYTSSNYRDFLAFFTSSYYLGVFPPKPYLSVAGNGKLSENSFNNNNLEKEYYLAMACISYYPIRDWYITNKIINAFNRQNQYQTFEKTEKVMMDFLPICQNAIYKDSLLVTYNRSKKYVPGKPAPAFTLQDENGKNVSLLEFKGKIVLLDFWGVRCGPCIADLQETVPKVHEKYKGKNVVFINICVEDTKENWKEALKKYNVRGINLFAKGWESNPICKEYGIQGIPHYILIDKNGNYADYNCAAYSLLWKDNILDKILAEK